MTGDTSGAFTSGDRSTEVAEPTKCVSCGRFVSYSEMSDGTASFYFEPDNHFGPERSEWTCAKCAAEGK